MSIGLSGVVELHHAVLAWLADVIGEHGRAVLARRSVGELGAQTMAVEHVVAEDQRDAIAADEFPPQDEGMGKADRLVLDDVVELDAPGGAVAEQALIERQMLAASRSAGYRGCPPASAPTAGSRPSACRRPAAAAC